MRTSWALALIVALSVAASAQPSGSAPYQAALAKAEALRLAGDYEGVVQTLAPWVEGEGQRAEARHRLGLAFYRQQRFPKAIQHLAAALDLEEEDSKVWRETVEVLGLAYYFSDRAHDALPLFEQALSWNGNDLHLRYALAITYIHVRDLDKARIALAKLFDVPPDSPQSFLLAGHFMIREQFMKDGKFVTLEARRLAGKNPIDAMGVPEAEYRLGLVALTGGNYSDALEHFDRELALNPSHSLAWYYLGDAYLRMGQLGDAIAPLQRSIWLNQESTSSHLLLASVYFKQEQYSLAENSLRRALDLSSQSYEAHFLLARVYQKTGRAELAKRETEIAKQLLSLRHEETRYQGLRSAEPR